MVIKIILLLRGIKVEVKLGCVMIIFKNWFNLWWIVWFFFGIFLVGFKIVLVWNILFIIKMLLIGSNCKYLGKNLMYFDLVLFIKIKL